MTNFRLNQINFQVLHVPLNFLNNLTEYANFWYLKCFSLYNVKVSIASYKTMPNGTCLFNHLSQSQTYD